MNKRRRSVTFAMKHFTLLNKKQITFVLFCLLATACSKEKAIEQPIPFNHEIHISDAGLDCTDCHTGVESKMNASLPSIEMCESCHSEMLGESIAESLVVEAVNNNVEIHWKPIYKLDDHVFFSHRRHVKSGKILCNVCHGEVETLLQPPTHQLIPITMDGCMDCHQDKSISNDCLTCHV